MILAFIVAAAVLAADQLTKFWAQTALQPVMDIPLWDGVFHLHYARNTGAAFSMLEGQHWIFYIFTAVVVVGMVWYMVKHRSQLHPLLTVSMGLVIGGAIGNFIDRITLGYVVDFLYFKLINFAIFNVADSALVIGCIALAVYILFIHDRLAAKKGAAEAGNEPDVGNDQSEG